MPQGAAYCNASPADYILVTQGTIHSHLFVKQYYKLATVLFNMSRHVQQSSFGKQSGFLQCFLFGQCCKCFASGHPDQSNVSSENEKN